MLLLKTVLNNGKVDKFLLIGKRKTKQKDYILNCLKSNLNKHMTSIEIEDTLKYKKTPVGRATIYRCLNLLVKEGFVRKCRVDEKNSFYYQYIDDKNLCKEHFHFICSSCSQTIHFENQELFSFISGLKFDNKLLIDTPKTIFYGLCDRCRLKNTI